MILLFCWVVYYTYILKSLASGRYYIGQTSDLTLRLKRHNENLVKSTKNRGTWKIVHFEEYKTRSDAMQRERYLKSLKSKKRIEDLFLT